MLASITQLQNRLFHVMGMKRRAAKCTEMTTALAKHSKVLFFIAKYAIFMTLLSSSLWWSLEGVEEATTDSTTKTSLPTRTLLFNHF